MKRYETANRCFLAGAILLLIETVPTTTQADDWVGFERISLEEGLSQSVVNAIIQDSKGFMWFATQDGLNKYDGYTFEIYEHDPHDPTTLSDNYIECLIEDDTGIIWVGTYGGGLNSYDPHTETFTRYLHDPNDSNSPANNEIRALLTDQRGYLWIGTWGGGLDRFDPKREAFTHFTHDPEDTSSLSHNVVRSIFEDSSGNLWIGTWGGGLNRFDPERQIFSRYCSGSDFPEGPRSDRIRAICEEPDGDLWLGTDEGLNRFDPESSIFRCYRAETSKGHALASNEVTSLSPVESGGIWLGTYGGGLSKFRPDSETFYTYRHEPDDPQSLSHDDVIAVFEDRAGVLWVGTDTGGLSKYSPAKARFRHYTTGVDETRGLSHKDVWTLYEDRDGIVWIGTSNGLTRADLEHDEFRYYRHVESDETSLIDNEVFSLCQDSRGTLWIGTAGGFNKFDRLTGRFTRFTHEPNNPNSLSDPAVFVIKEAHGGVLWLGTEVGGLNRFDPVTGAFVRYQHDSGDDNSLCNDEVMSILVDREGVVWVGTGQGLDRFDPETEEFIHYRYDPEDPKSLSNNAVYTLVQSQGGDLWIGTRSGGLNRFDKESQTFEYFTQKDGLPGNAIYGIQEDNSRHLWISTNRGLSRFDPELQVFKNYDVRDGLQSNEFNQGASHRGFSGTMYFGGINGFNAFNPELITDNPMIPPIILTSFKVFGKDMRLDRSIEVVETIRLSYRQNFFSFEFVALDFTVPEKNQYAYRMEGLDEAWVECGTRRYASYTGLDPGHYTFRVKGSNNDGVWNERGTRVRLIVDPPFWQTWWFQGLTALTVVGLAFGWYKARVRRLESQKRELEQQVAARTKELREKNIELTEAYQKVERAARTDPLTELSNRRDMITRIKHEMQRFAITNRPFAIAIGDIDDFKSFNDLYGHDVGDCVLIRAAAIMRETVRKQDRVGRWGGEEFMILLPETDPDGGMHVAERVRVAIAEESFSCNGHDLSISMTFGVSEWQETLSIDHCIKAADDAMYQGKEQGKNRVVAAPSKRGGDIVPDS